MSRWIKLARVEDCKGDSCPAVHLAPDGRLFVRGRRASDDVRKALALRPEEDAVEVTRDLFVEALDALRHPGEVR